MDKKMEKKETIDQLVVIPEISLAVMPLTVVGKTPYLTNAIAPETVREIEERQLKKTREKPKTKDDKEMADLSFYKHPDGVAAIKTGAFKKAFIGACRFLDKDVPMTLVRGAVVILGDFLPIKGSNLRMRADVTRNKSGGAIIVHRYEIAEWSVELMIQYNARIFSPSHIANLLNTAGFHIGVGAWRPESKCGGTFGMFEVKLG